MIRLDPDSNKENKVAYYSAVGRLIEKVDPANVDLQSLTIRARFIVGGFVVYNKKTFKNRDDLGCELERCFGLQKGGSNYLEHAYSRVSIPDCRT